MLIKLIGPTTVQHGGAPPRHLSGAQAQVAFSRLILERAAGTSRDQLADTVWPDGLPNTWASALRSVVSRIRRFVVGPHTGVATTPLLAQSGWYRLELPAGAAVDLEAAEAAVTEATSAFGAGDHARARSLAAGAVAGVRGSFLPSHDGEWVNGVRDHIDDLRLSALELASLSASALGDEHAAVRYADEAVRRAPFRESAHHCRMTALAAAGNRADALRTYHRLREVLAEELGVDPSPETQETYLRLLRTPDLSRPLPARRAQQPRHLTPDPAVMGAFEALGPMPPAPRRCTAAAGCAAPAESCAPGRCDERMTARLLSDTAHVH